MLVLQMDSYFSTTTTTVVATIAIDVETVDKELNLYVWKHLIWNFMKYEHEVCEAQDNTMRENISNNSTSIQ